MRAIDVSVQRGDGELSLSYTIEAEMARLRIPPARTPRIGRELWTHTCCECFLALKGRAEYCEFNFSPSGEWAAYAFAKYRDGAPLMDEALNPRIAVLQSADRLQLDATILLERLSPMHARGVLALALCAVIEERDGTISYWALTHPISRPDFHSREAFVVEV